MAGEFDDAGREYQAKEEPAEQPENDARRFRFRSPGERMKRGEKDGEDAGFQEKGIPLKAEEILAGDGEREIESVEQNEGGELRDADDDEDRGDDSGDAEEVEECVTRVQPAESRELRESVGAEDLAGDLEEVADGEDAGGADEAVDLGVEGGECEEVDEAE